MQDQYDHVTLNLLLDETALQSTCATKPRVGRPRNPNALSDAERARSYRARKKARRADLRDESKPLSSKIIDLSALPAWKRK